MKNKTPDKQNMIREIKMAAKYVFSAGLSFAIDLGLFTLFHFLLQGLMGRVEILAATVMARVLSSLFNYFLNSRFVFKAYDKKSIIKYYALVVIQMINSAVLVFLLSLALGNVHATVIKFFVEVCIFVVNYVVQKKYIFQAKKEKIRTH